MTPAVHVVVFSKDRPLQLHGYLTSLFAQWQGAFKVTVLARMTEPYASAYGHALTSGGGPITVMQETAFAADLRAIVEAVDAPLTCFGCDDAVFVHEVNTGVLAHRFGAQPRLLGVSLRLGETIERGMWGHAMAQPRFLNAPRQFEVFPSLTADLEWDCTASGSAGDWAYPWDVVGTVYRTDFVRRVVEGLVANELVHNPSTLEHYGARWWHHHAEGATLMRAWHRPRLVLPTVNVVQSVFPNGVVGDDRLTPEFLLECWNRGLRLDTQRYATAPQPDSWRTGDLYLRRAA